MSKPQHALAVCGVSIVLSRYRRVASTLVPRRLLYRRHSAWHDNSGEPRTIDASACAPTVRVRVRVRVRVEARVGVKARVRVRVRVRVKARV